MKKGLLSILAGALVVVGCQNYDDQFNNLESQISALASTVAGLSQVQSDLSSLAGTVSSLQSSVANLGSTIDTAVADGLADIQADITAIEAAVADVASSEEVTALQESVNQSQEDLEELLANSAVFNGDVTINSPATLNAFHQMGGALAIVNGNVTMDITPSMDIEKVQAVADVILTITKDLDYEATESSVAEVVFNNLSGVQSLTVTQAGGYKFPELVSAKDVTLGDDFDSKVTIVDFRKLADVESIATGTNDHAVVFNKATEIHLTAVKMYSGTSANNPLTLESAVGGVIDITALDDVDGDGDQKDLHLNITGPSSLTVANLTDGSIEVTDIATVSISDFAGSITVNDGVLDLTVDNGVIVDVTGADDLSDASIDLKLDDDEDLSSTATAALVYANEGELDFTDLTDLTDLTITGTVGDITLSGNDNLVSVTINAVGRDLSISDAGDLETLVVTGSSLHDVTISDVDLTELVLDHTTILTTMAKTAEKAGAISVTDNPKLESLSISADKIDSLTITGNEDLATVDFTGLATIGNTTANVSIKENALTATKAVDDWDSATATTDTGSYTSDSGLDTIETYLTAAIAAPGTSGVIVYFDEVEITEDQATENGDYDEDADYTVDYTDADNFGAVAYITAADPAAAKNQTQSFWIAIDAASIDDVDGTSGINYSELNDSSDLIEIDYPVAADTTYDFEDANVAGDEAFADLDAYIEYFNEEADLDGFDLTLSLTGGKQKVYLLNYVETDGSDGAVSGAGSILFDYGTSTGLATSIEAADDDLDLAEAFAEVIDGLASFQADYGGAEGYAYVIVNAVEEADEQDVTPKNKWTMPDYITVSLTGSSATWSANATNGETSYTLSVGKGVARYSGFILTAVNTNQARDREIAIASTGGFFGTDSELSNGSFYNGGEIDGKTTTSTDDEIGAYVRAYDDIEAKGVGEDTDRTAWL